MIDKFYKVTKLRKKMEEKIEVIGLEDFEEQKKSKIEEEIENLFKKFETHSHVGGISKVKVYIKEYHEGKNKKYSVKLDIIFTSRKFEADSTDWILTKALRKAFLKLSEEIEHEFHNKGLEKR